MTKGILAILIIVLITLGCTNSRKKTTGNNSDSNPVKSNTESLQKYTSLACTNGYTIRYKVETPDDMSIEVIKGNKIEKHSMKNVISGSGAKYQTNDGEYVFWSHHGDFTYYINGQKICSYTAPIKIGSTSTGPSYTVTYKSDKRLIIDVDTTKSASINKLDFRSSDFKDVSIQLETDPIKNVFLDDLDQNGFEELYLITTSAGSGSYAELYVFIANKDEKIIQASLPEISENEIKKGAMFEGYMGHDTFYIKNSLLVREFPVYKENDTNAKPTGGLKKVFYFLRNNHFQIVTNYKEITELVRKNNFIEVDKWLKNGGDPNILLPYGSTLLGIATGPKGGYEVVKLLIDAGADVNKGKYTPLMNAASWISLDMVELLLENGANPNLKNEEGQTALDLIGDTNNSPSEIKLRSLLKKLTNKH